VVDVDAREHHWRQPLQPPRRIVVCSCRERVPDRLGEQMLSGEPGARPPVQCGRLRVRGLADQPRAEHVGEQVVVAVPDPLVVQRNEEQIGSVQLLKQRLPVTGVVANNRVAQRRTQPVQQGRRRQEPARA
jgi:hypothetical protein